MLGLFGEPATTGKGVIEDLREGKQTLLMLRALELADAAGRRELERVLCRAGHGGPLDATVGDATAGRRPWARPPRTTPLRGAAGRS